MQETNVVDIHSVYRKLRLDRIDRSYVSLLHANGEPVDGWQTAMPHVVDRFRGICTDSVSVEYNQKFLCGIRDALESHNSTGPCTKVLYSIDSSQEWSDECRTQLTNIGTVFADKDTGEKMVVPGECMARLLSVELSFRSAWPLSVSFESDAKVVGDIIHAPIPDDAYLLRFSYILWGLEGVADAVNRRVKLLCWI